MKKVFEIVAFVLSYGFAFIGGVAFVAYEYLKWHPDKFADDFLYAIYARD